MDYQDRLDAERALSLARSHGENNNSFFAVRDRLDAEIATNRYNHTIRSMAEYHGRMGDNPVDTEILG